MSGKDTGELSNKGDKFKRAGNIEAAIDCYQQAIELAPDNDVYYFKLGKLFKEQEKIVNASIYYRQAIKIKPECSWYYHGLGEILTQQDELEAAASCYYRAIELNPDFSWSHYNLGRILHQKNNLETAKSCYQKVIELTPDYPWVYYFLAAILTQKQQFKAAIDCYYQSIKLNPDCLASYQALGNILHNLEPDLLAEYRQKLQAVSDLEQAYLEVSLGQAWQHQNQTQKAIDCYEKAIEIEPYFELPYQLISHIYGTSENPKNYQRFLILCHPRTGSNFLVSLLQSHPQIRAFGELFTEDNNLYWGYSGYRTQRIKELRSENPVLFLEKLVYRPTFPAIVKAAGFKLLYSQPKQKHQKIVWQYLEEIENLKIIHLTRKNIFHTYVSHEVAKITNQFTLLKNEKDHGESNLLEPIFLDYKQCLLTFEQIRNWEIEYGNFFNKSTQMYYNLVYEHLVNDLDQETSKLQEFLGVEKQQLSSYTRKQSRKPIKEIVVNYEPLKEQYRNSCWSEFFDE